MLYIDLYLSEYLTHKYQNAPNPHIRMIAAPCRGGEIHTADILISTHKHSDHMDPETVPQILHNCKDAIYLLPPAHFEHVAQWGIDTSRCVGAWVDQAITVRDITILPQPAKHEAFDYDAVRGYPHLSYIIKADGVTFYHSGDTIPYCGLVERLREQRVEVALLPVNGRDRFRHACGTPGNCTGEEALCLCACAGIKTLIPHHYNMFSFNTIDIQSFGESAKELYPEIDCRIVQCAEKIIFKGES